MGTGLKFLFEEEVTMKQGTILGSQIGRWIVLAALVALLGALLLTIRPVGAQSDGRPVIDQAPATFTHAEKSDSSVYTFRADDPERKTIFWTLSGTDAADFEIDGGVLSFKSAPNFEMPTDRANPDVTPPPDEEDNVYNVTVRFSDGGTPAGEHSVTVTVTNVEEDGSVSISPLQPQEGSELTATVTDPDGNVQAEYQWSKSGTMSGTYDDIADADEMTYTPTADDVGSHLRVTARYVDGHGSDIDDPVMATSTKSVRADTTANEAPTIPDQNISTDDVDTAITRHVLENMPAGTMVGPPVTAVDDNIDDLTYAFGGTPAQMTAAESFDIDPATGQITTNRPLNEEVTASYEVVVTATDADGDVATTATITINVTDVDEAPNFTGTPAREMNVAENMVLLDTDPDTAGTQPPAVYAVVDPEEPDEETHIVWSLEGDDSEWFSISNETPPDQTPRGQLTMSTARNFEAPTDANKDNVYELTVVAADSLYDDAKESRLIVTVKVIDEDEAQAPGSITIFNLQPEVDVKLFLEGGNNPLSDGDGGIRNIKWQWYARDGCPGGVFDPTDTEDGDPDIVNTASITSSWTKITTLGTSSSYTPTPDNFNGAPDCLMVRANYLDNGPPGVDVITTQDHDESRQYAYAVSANAVQAEDDNNDKPMFDDGDDSTQGIQTRATIAENTGALTVVSAITAQTMAISTMTGGVPIMIGVVEDSNAGDPDTLTFTLGGTDAGSFMIDKMTGVVTINSSPDYETKDSYTFVVIATDPTNGKDDRDRRTNGITVLLEVTDVDEVAQFTAMPTHVVYEENGTGPVAAYPAMDEDDDAFIWDLSGADAEDFEISQLGGILRFVDPPDFESADDTDTDNEYVVIVNLRQESDDNEVIDTNDAVVDMVTVNVKVIDVAEAPVFTNDAITLNIDENQYPDMMRNRPVTGSPQAYDDDMYRPVSLTYTMDPMYGTFSIVPATGELRTTKVLDYERLANTSFVVTVTATDPTGDSDSIEVTIDVNNVDEPPVGGRPNQAPAFASTTMTRSVAENTAAGMPVGDAVAAIDSENDGVTFTLGGDDAGHFTIDAATGQLMTSGALNYESKDSYTVTVTATDDADDPLYSMATVTIMVTDEDEPGAVTGLPTSLMVGTVLTATLTDPDTGVTNITWQWSSAGADIDGETSASYTVASSDAGMSLMATATYDDVHGSQTAPSAAVMVEAVDPVLAKYDTDPKDGKIGLKEATEILRRFLADPADVSLSEAVAVLRLFQSNTGNN